MTEPVDGRREQLERELARANVELEEARREVEACTRRVDDAHRVLVDHERDGLLADIETLDPDELRERAADAAREYATEARRSNFSSGRAWRRFRVLLGVLAKRAGAKK